MSASTAKKLRMENGEAVAVNHIQEEVDDETTRKRKTPSKKPSTVSKQNEDDSDTAKKQHEKLMEEAASEHIIDDDFDCCNCKKEVTGKAVKCADSECQIKIYHMKYMSRKAKKAAPKQQSTPKTNKVNAESIATVVSNKISKKSKNVEEKETSIHSTNKYNNFPSREITKDDVENARKREREIRNERMEAREKGIQINNCNEHWLKLAGSSIHGFGMFAIKEIAEGTPLIEYTGQIISSKSELKRKEKQYKKEGIKETYFFTADDNKTLIDATKEGSEAKYVNHSCVPNVKSKDLSKNGKTKIIFYAKKQIYKGEELTMDYCFDYDPKEKERIECKCGAKNCKKYIDL